MKTMEHHNMAAGFIGGSVVGAYSGLKIFFLQSAYIHPVEFGVKAAGTVILAIIGGLAGMVAKDFYTFYLQPKIKRLFKKK